MTSTTPIEQYHDVMHQLQLDAAEINYAEEIPMNRYTVQEVCTYDVYADNPVDAEFAVRHYPYPVPGADVDLLEIDVAVVETNEGDDSDTDLDFSPLDAGGSLLR